MKVNVYNDIDSVAPLRYPIVSIGFFDGVHLGHKYLLKQLVEVSEKRKVDHLLISMWPHPKEITQNLELENFLLNTLDEKIDLFSKTGIKHLLILDFTENIAEFSSEDFIRKILLDKLNAAAILLGFNNSFGKPTKTKLEDIASKYSIELIKSEPCCKQFTDVKISSSAIRDMLINGKIEDANHLLGYNYSWSGKVTDGYKIGRSLGFPTANLETLNINKLLPGIGVYLVYAIIDGKRFEALLNIGYRPTFDGDKKSIELHIIDFSKNIYKLNLNVEFVKRLREEKRFKNVGELKNQLQQDLHKAREFFSKNRKLLN